MAPSAASAQSFFDNFLKPEYIVPIAELPGYVGGDFLLTYYQVAIPLLGAGELLIVGEYPRARYLSITAYDDHGAVIGKLDDKDIQPFFGGANPFQIGGPAGAEDTLYAVTVRLDDTMATAPVAQCATPFDVHRNVLDMRSRHTAGTFYSSDQSGFTANVPGRGLVSHVDSPRNTAGFLLIRTYMQEPAAPTSRFDLRKPLVWVRATSTGCAAPLAPPGQFLPLANWFSLGSVLDIDQLYGHVQHEVDLGTSDPFGPDPSTNAPWQAVGEYLPGQAVGRYLKASLPIDPATLNAQGRVMELQLRLPAMPCRSAICTLTGEEELRYWGVTLEDQPGHSLASFSELSLAPDADGYVTLVVSFGTPVPAHVTAANGYSQISLPQLAAARLVLRNQLPATGFACSIDSVPPRTAEYHPNGGYMGEYAPVVSFPLASALPPVATPLVQGGSCQYP